MQTVPGEFRPASQPVARVRVSPWLHLPLEGGRVPRSVVDLLCELIAQPSVNPRLAPPGAAEAGESRVTN